MKSLKTVQTLAKLGKVLSRIAFICSIVGAILCTVGIVGYAAFGDGSMRLGGLTVRGMIEKRLGLTVAETYAAMGTGLVFLIGEIAVSRLAVGYFSDELTAGTPFTGALARELRTLGIVDICVGLGASVVSGMLMAALNVVGQTADRVSIGGSFSAGLGIAMIITSVLCDYGAELRRRGG